MVREDMDTALAARTTTYLVHSDCIRTRMCFALMRRDEMRREEKTRKEKVDKDKDNNSDCVSM